MERLGAAGSLIQNDITISNLQHQPGIALDYERYCPVQMDHASIIRSGHSRKSLVAPTPRQSGGEKEVQKATGGRRFRG